MPVDVTAKYLRIRVANPKNFMKGTLRTHDIGRKGHSKRIAGVHKYTGRWETQSWLLLKKDIKEYDMRTIKLLNEIASETNMRLAIAKAVKQIQKK